VLLLEGAAAIAAADLQHAASAALAGTSPEDFQVSCDYSSPSAAAAVLVAGLIAVRAGQRGGGSGCGSPCLDRRGSGSRAGPADSPAAAAAAACSPPDKAAAGGRRARPLSAPVKGRAHGAAPSPGVSAASPAATCNCKPLAFLALQHQRHMLRAFTATH
jgi:hypothetical protein